MNSGLQVSGKQDAWLGVKKPKNSGMPSLSFYLDFKEQMPNFRQHFGKYHLFATHAAKETILALISSQGNRGSEQANNSPGLQSWELVSFARLLFFR